MKAATNIMNPFNYLLRPYAKSASADLSLWNYKDQRLDMGVFATNVPSLIINQDQTILDYNIAFELFFGDKINLKSKPHIREWYKILENFKRIPSRTEALYGEGLLPITDRHRVVYVSSKYGRAVFSKIMQPIIDRKTAKILGWSIVLNINSVHHRLRFFEELDVATKKHIDQLKFISSFDSVIQSHSDFQKILKLHTDLANTNGEVLSMNSFTGEVGLRLAASGIKTHILEHHVEHLRTIRSKVSAHLKSPELVYQQESELKLPENRFSHILFTHGLGITRAQVQKKFEHILESLQESGSICISGFDPNIHTNKSVVHEYFKADLRARGDFDTIKYQFAHTIEYYLEETSKHYLSAKDFKRLANLHGLTIHTCQTVGAFYFIQLKK